MTASKTVQQKLIKKLLISLEKAYNDGDVSLAYVKRTLKRYDIDLTTGKSRRNPHDQSNLVEIYSDIEKIEARRGNDSLWYRERFQHTFKKNTNGSVFGTSKMAYLYFSDGSRVKVPKGSLLVISRSGKHLWKMFEYDSKYDGIDNE